MSKSENINKLQEAITELLVKNEATDFRWATEEERGDDESYDACLVVDGDAHFYCWDQDGLGEMNQVSTRYGFGVEPLNYIDIGFYSLTDLQSGKL